MNQWDFGILLVVLLIIFGGVRTGVNNLHVIAGELRAIREKMDKK
jgi:hypothetical protein